MMSSLNQCVRVARSHTTAHRELAFDLPVARRYLAYTLVDYILYKYDCNLQYVLQLEPRKSQNDAGTMD